MFLNTLLSVVAVAVAAFGRSGMASGESASRSSEGALDLVHEHNMLRQRNHNDAYLSNNNINHRIMESGEGMTKNSAQRWRPVVKPIPSFKAGSEDFGSDSPLSGNANIIHPMDNDGIALPGSDDESQVDSDPILRNRRLDESKWYSAYSILWSGTGLSWEFEQGMCDDPTLEATLTCGGSGRIEVFNPHGFIDQATCSVDANHAGRLICDPTSSFSEITVRCIGSTHADLAITAQLPTTQTECSGTCSEFIFAQCGRAEQRLRLYPLCDSELYHNMSHVGACTPELGGGGWCHSTEGCYGEATNAGPCTTTLLPVTISSLAVQDDDTCIHSLSVCGDGTCSQEEDTMSCPEDCPPECGDGICSPSEDALTCPNDCRYYEGDKSITYFVDFGGSSFDDSFGVQSCDDFYPAPSLTCSSNGYISIVSFSGENHDCIYDEGDLHTVLCNSLPPNIGEFSRIYVKCIGYAPEDLKLVVTLPKKSVRCTGSTGTWRTGTARQMASIASLCDSTWQQKPFDCSGNVFNADIDICHTNHTCYGKSFMDMVCYANLDPVTITSDAYLDETCYEAVSPLEGGDIEPQKLQDDKYSIKSGTTLSVSKAEGLLHNDIADKPIEVGTHTVNDPFYGELAVFDDGSFEYEAPDKSVMGSNQNLEVSFEYEACYIDLPNVCSTAEASIVITTDNVDSNTELPKIQDDKYSVTSGTALSVSITEGLLHNDIADQPIRATFYTTNDPFYGELTVFSDGSFEYQAPNESVLESNQSLEVSFSYTACYIDLPDLCSTAMASIIITGDEVDSNIELPQLQDDEYSVISAILNVSKTEGLLHNDIADQPIKVTSYILQDPFYGELTVFADGSFEYQAPNESVLWVNPNLEASFTYTACYVDLPEVCSNATVSLLFAADKVDSNVEPPKLQDDEYTVIFGNMLSVSTTEGLLNNGIADQPIKVTSYILQDPFYGELTVFESGRFEYQSPDEGILDSDETLTDSFTYTVCFVDLPDLCSTAEASIVINVDNDGSDIFHT